MNELHRYDALVAKVEVAGHKVTERRRADLSCRAGCSACCLVSLSVSPVEAAAILRFLPTLPAETRDRLRLRGQSAEKGRCAMLEDDGTCAVYPARPLVCRTQGLPLRYPPGLLPAASVRARTTERGQGVTGDLCWCPLNFTLAPPAGEDVLDADRVDQMLAMVNQDFVGRSAGDRPLDPLSRTPLSTLAAQTTPTKPAAQTTPTKIE